MSQTRKFIRAHETPGQDHTFRAGDGRARFNLLGWDGRGDAPHLFPERGGS